MMNFLKKLFQYEQPAEEVSAQAELLQEPRAVDYNNENTVPFADIGAMEVPELQLRQDEIGVLQENFKAETNEANGCGRSILLLLDLAFAF